MLGGNLGSLLYGDVSVRFRLQYSFMIGHLYLFESPLHGDSNRLPTVHGSMT